MSMAFFAKSLPKIVTQDRFKSKLVKRSTLFETLLYFIVHDDIELQMWNLSQNETLQAALAP